MASAMRKIKDLPKQEKNKKLLLKMCLAILYKIISARQKTIWGPVICEQFYKRQQSKQI